MVEWELVVLLETKLENYWWQIGELLVEFSSPFGVGFNNQPEVEPALFGVVWSLQIGINKVLLEVNS